MRLMEIDGSMTFIELFYEPVLVVTPFIRPSVCLLFKLNSCPAENPADTQTHTHNHRQTHTHTDTVESERQTLCISELQPEAA